MLDNKHIFSYNVLNLRRDYMLFEPPIDLLVKVAGNRYAVASIVGARAKTLINKIPAMLNGSANLAIDHAANELLRGDITGVSSKK